MADHAAEDVSLSITAVKLSLESEKPGRNVYMDFRRGEEDVQTEVIEGVGGDGKPITWNSQLDLANPTGTTDKLQVRAYDKYDLLPDGLLGAATVDVHALGPVADPTEPGAGGGTEVQAPLIGRWGQLGGHVTFYVTMSGGAPSGGSPHPSQPSGSEASGKVATTAGFVGAGATAFPVERAGQDLHGEHLSDFDGKAQSTSGDGTSSPTAGFSGGGATAFPAQEAGKDLHGEHLSDFENKGTGSNREAPSSPTAGFSGGGATAFPAQEAGKDLHGEHLSDFENKGNSNVRKAAPTTGFPGGGATAFPAEASGKGLRGEHLSDFDISKGSSSVDKPPNSPTAGFLGGGATAFPAEASGKDLHGEHLSDFDPKAESDSRAPIAISSTAGYGGGGATAFPAEDSGKKLRGEHLSDFGGKTGGVAAGGGGSTSGGRPILISKSVPPSAGDVATEAPGSGMLMVGNIAVKLVKNKGIIGSITPYVVFSVGHERGATDAVDEAFEPNQHLRVPGQVTLDLGASATDELLVDVYNKRKLLPDEQIGEAQASLAALRRGTPVTLRLAGTGGKRRGGKGPAGTVSFVLDGGGAGGSSIGNASDSKSGAGAVSDLSIKE